MALGLGDPCIYSDIYPARVTAVHAGPSYSILAYQESWWIPYGPSVNGEWTNDPTPVTIGAGVGYISPAETDSAQNVYLDANALAAATASDEAALKDTSLVMQSVTPNSWLYEDSICGWRYRFTSESISLRYNAPKKWNIVRLVVKDVAPAQMQIQIYASPVISSPTSPSWTLLASGASSGSGLVQTVDINIPAHTGKSRYKIVVTTGGVNGGILPADQWQLLQIVPINVG